MSKLIMTLDGAVVREYPIEKDSISIGRKHGNDIQLNDLTVSGRHSLIVKMGEHVYVDDLGSTNGTLLNGARVAKTLIKHGDVIQGSSMQGMQRMDTALRRLLDAKLISGDDAYLKARNKADFERFRESYEENQDNIQTESSAGETKSLL